MHCLTVFMLAFSHVRISFHGLVPLEIQQFHLNVMNLESVPEMSNITYRHLMARNTLFGASAVFSIQCSPSLVMLLTLLQGTCDFSKSACSFHVTQREEVAPNPQVN